MLEKPAALRNSNHPKPYPPLRPKARPHVRRITRQLIPPAYHETFPHLTRGKPCPSKPSSNPSASRASSRSIGRLVKNASNSSKPPTTTCSFSPPTTSSSTFSPTPAPEPCPL